MSLGRLTDNPLLARNVAEVVLVALSASISLAGLRDWLYRMVCLAAFAGESRFARRASLVTMAISRTVPPVTCIKGFDVGSGFAHGLNADFALAPLQTLRLAVWLVPSIIVAGSPSWVLRDGDMLTAQLMLHASLLSRIPSAYSVFPHADGVICNLCAPVFSRVSVLSLPGALGHSWLIWFA